MMGIENPRVFRKGLIIILDQIAVRLIDHDGIDIFGIERIDQRIVVPILYL